MGRRGIEKKEVGDSCEAEAPLFQTGCGVLENTRPGARREEHGTLLGKRRTAKRQPFSLCFPAEEMGRNAIGENKRKSYSLYSACRSLAGAKEGIREKAAPFSPFFPYFICRYGKQAGERLQSVPFPKYTRQKKAAGFSWRKKDMKCPALKDNNKKKGSRVKIRE